MGWCLICQNLSPCPTCAIWASHLGSACLHSLFRSRYVNPSCKKSHMLSFTNIPMPTLFFCSLTIRTEKGGHRYEIVLTGLASRQTRVWEVWLSTSVLQSTEAGVERHLAGPLLVPFSSQERQLRNKSSTWSVLRSKGWRTQFCHCHLDYGHR